MGLRGPKPWEPSEEELSKIRLYAGLGSTQAQIGAMIGKSADSLQNNEAAYTAWQLGHAEIIAKVAGTLVRKALSGDTASAIFFLKTQGGWRETNVQEHTGKVDVSHRHTIDPTQLSEATLQEIAALAKPDNG